MAYWATQETQPINAGAAGLGCASCAGVGAYEAWTVGHTPMPRLRRARRFYPQAGLGAIVAVSGLGADPTTPPAPPPAPTPAITPADAERAGAIGKGLFLGGAYGIAIGIAISTFVARQRDPATQLKQDRKFMMLAALFGAAVGAVTGVQAPTPQA